MLCKKKEKITCCEEKSQPLSPRYQMVRQLDKDFHCKCNGIFQNVVVPRAQTIVTSTMGFVMNGQIKLCPGLVLGTGVLKGEDTS